MIELKREELSVRHERAVLVSLLLPDSRYEEYNPLGELASLARTAGAHIVDGITQKRKKRDPAYFIGKGKAEEVRDRAEANKANVVIFDNDLSPAQIRELEKIINLKIIDRSELILDIFAARARTHEAKLQVELAQLEYTAPRLRGMWSHLERIAGAGGGGSVGVVGGIGTRGPGERQIEIDRRLVSKRISALQAQIARIDRRKQQEIRSRSDEYNVSLVGYTNAGKSTLMNALTGGDQLVESKLFATLDTKTRKWHLGGGQTALLSDTVGFVRDLPHRLVASFKATLEETIFADLLLHVVDASSPTADMQVEAVENVLEEIQAGDKKTLILLNKMDQDRDESIAQVLEKRYPDTIRISAQTGQGLDEVCDFLRRAMQEKAGRFTIRAPIGDGKMFSFLDRHAKVLDRRYETDAVEVDVLITHTHLSQLQSRFDSIEIIRRDDEQSV